MQEIQDNPILTKYSFSENPFSPKSRKLVTKWNIFRIKIFGFGTQSLWKWVLRMLSAALFIHFTVKPSMSRFEYAQVAFLDKVMQDKVMQRELCYH